MEASSFLQIEPSYLQRKLSRSYSSLKKTQKRLLKTAVKITRFRRHSEISTYFLKKWQTAITKELLLQSKVIRCERKIEGIAETISAWACTSGFEAGYSAPDYYKSLQFKMSLSLEDKQFKNLFASLKSKSTTLPELNNT